MADTGWLLSGMLPGTLLLGTESIRWRMAIHKIMERELYLPKRA